MTDSSTDVPCSVWQGSFRVLGVELKCHVLSDGRRIIEEDSMNKLLEAMANGTGDRGDLEEFIRWQKR